MKDRRLTVRRLLPSWWDQPNRNISNYCIIFSTRAGAFVRREPSPAETKYSLEQCNIRHLSSSTASYEDLYPWLEFPCYCLESYPNARKQVTHFHGWQHISWAGRTRQRYSRERVDSGQWPGKKTWRWCISGTLPWKIFCSHEIRCGLTLSVSLFLRPP